MHIVLRASHSLECPICAFLSMQLSNLRWGHPPRRPISNTFSAEDNVPCLQKEERRFAHGVGLNCTDRHRSPQIPQITQVPITDTTDHSEMAQIPQNSSNMPQGCQIITLMSLWHPWEQFKRYPIHQQYIQGDGSGW